MTKHTPKEPIDKITVKKADKIEAPDDEKGGFKDNGLAEPTRFNDWEVKGRCSDF